MTAVSDADFDRRRVASEVLELGETLFDAVHDAATRTTPTESDEPFPAEEVRVAADEFFRALRALLDLSEDGSEPLAT